MEPFKTREAERRWTSRKQGAGFGVGAPGVQSGAKRSQWAITATGQKVTLAGLKTSSSSSQVGDVIYMFSEKIKLADLPPPARQVGATLRDQAAANCSLLA